MPVRGMNRLICESCDLADPSVVLAALLRLAPGGASTGPRRFRHLLSESVSRRHSVQKTRRTARLVVRPYRAALPRRRRARWRNDPLVLDRFPFRLRPVGGLLRVPARGQLPPDCFAARPPHRADQPCHGLPPPHLEHGGRKVFSFPGRCPRIDCDFVKFLTTRSNSGRVPSSATTYLPSATARLGSAR